MDVFTGPERRRRWSDEQKLAILSEVGVQGASVADIARRHDISRQHIYQWRREMRRKGWLEETAPVFLPVEVSETRSALLADAQREAPAPQSGWAEIHLTNGRQLRVAADLAPDLLTRLIRAMEAA